jgi:signal peptidase complex subunit 3
LAFSIDADLTSVFSWNTKLLFVYLAAEYATPLNAQSQARLRWSPARPGRR